MRKTRTYIVILLLTMVWSCSNQEGYYSDLERTNRELLGTNRQLQDSIDRLHALPDFSRFPDSLGIDTNRSLFGSLILDTLVLFAEYSNCGEFGGSREWLKIYNDKDDSTKALFVYDSVVCRYQNQEKKYFRIENSEYIINKSQQQLVLNYLFDLTRMSFLERDIRENSGSFFYAYITPGSDLPLLFDYKVSFYDAEFGWNHFRELKNKIKTTANNRTKQMPL